MRAEFVPFMLPSLVEDPPDGDDWIHEIKLDGYRTQLVISEGQARLFTRNGHDWTEKYRPIAAAAERLGIDGTVIDGEMIVNDAAGKPDFKALKAAMRSAPDRLVFMAFDLIHLGGHDYRAAQLRQRGTLLGALLGRNRQANIQFSEAFDGEPAEILAAIERMGLEGMVSKRLSSRYQSGRTMAWQKTKCFDETELSIIGVQRERGKPAMVLMADEAGNYKGGAFVTLPRGIRERLWQRVQEKAGAPPPKGLAREKAEWIKPGLVGRVRTLKGEEKLRHARLLEVRDDG